MNRLSYFIAALFSAFILLLNGAVAQQYSPTFDYQNVMNTYFDDNSGLISFQNGRVIFAPEGKFNGKIAVLDEKQQVVTSFSFYPEYRPKVGVYAWVGVKTPADVTLSKPGVYQIVYLVDGKPVTRFPFRLVQASAGNDPFNPQKTYRFDGYWRTFAYITINNWGGKKVPEINYWLGGMDLPEGKSRDRQIVTLYRNGKMVAHSKRTSGEYQSGHFKEYRTMLYHIHPAGKEANAVPFALNDWQVDGTYEVRVNRLADGVALRSYDFKVVNGKIEGHPRSKLGYQPQIDYIAPRVQKRGSTQLELVEAIWIEDRKL